MKSDFNNNVLNKLQSTNTSTESALLKINDKLDKIDKFESIFSKKIEYVMLEMKNVKESLKSKFEFNVEKCENEKDAVLDQKTNDYIKKLELKLLEKENLIKAQSDEIELLSEKANISEQLSNYSQMLLYQKLKLQEKLSIKDKSLEEFEKSNVNYLQDVEVLINLLRKSFPKIKEIDSDLDNAAVVKIIESFIEEQNSESVKYKSDFEKFKKELSNKEKIVKDKESVIESLENYISEYEYKNCQLKVIESDLETYKSRVEDSNKHTSILKSENKQLKEKVKLLEDYKIQTEANTSNQRLEILDKPFDPKKEHISITDNITIENSNKGAEKYYDKQIFGYYYSHTNNEYAEDDCAIEVKEKDDLYNLMVTDKEGENLTVYEVYLSLSYVEDGIISDYMNTKKKNICEALKHFDFII